MNWVDWLTSSSMLAVYGGLLSSLRTTVKDKTKSFSMSVVDTLIGVAIALVAADYFVSPEYPKLSIIIGLVAGSLGTYLMDALQAAAPNLAKGVIENFAKSFGYKKIDPPNKENKHEQS